MWTCSSTKSSIKVAFRGALKGEYLLIQEPYCRKCARQGVTTDSCTWHWKCYGFERTYAMGLYYPSRGDPSSVGWDDFLSNHIRGLKMYPRYAIPLGLGLTLCINNIYTELKEMNLIVPVPKFRTELKTAANGSGETYNQAEELSKIISRETNIPYANILEKTKEQKMKQLPWDEKWKVVRGLYKFPHEQKEIIEGKRVILVDDVFTSGADVSECSQELLSGGAERVNALVAGRDTGE